MCKLTFVGRLLCGLRLYASGRTRKGVGIEGGWALWSYLLTVSKTRPVHTDRVWSRFLLVRHARHQALRPCRTMPSPRRFIKSSQITRYFFFLPLRLLASRFGADTLTLPSITAIASISGTLFISSFSRCVTSGLLDRKNDVACLMAAHTKRYQILGHKSYVDQIRHSSGYSPFPFFSVPGVNFTLYLYF